ncbi:unnamed protein product, partial [Porites lobata]
MEQSFKNRVAAAAREYCAKAQCFPNQSRRRRLSLDVKFTADMVHILPGYPKQSDDSPGVILLAFYLSLPKGISESSLVPQTNIQTSIGGEIVSADPLPLDTEEHKENNGQSKPLNVIIGSSLGGGLLLIIIAAAL